MEELVQPASRGELPRREAMQTPDEVAAMLRLKASSWAADRGRTGVQPHDRPLVPGRGWLGRVSPAAAGRERWPGLRIWIATRLHQHAGNADVIRQELEREKGIRLSVRTVEREVRHLRRELEADARATIRFETPPGTQPQSDFGERRVSIGNENVRVYLFVAKLSYSRRLYVRPFRNERQESWFAGVEGAFRHFGGITDEVLLDDDRGLAAPHDRATGEVELKCSIAHFRQALGFRPRACAPDRSRTKGKDELGVGYVKENAIAGRHFESWSVLGSSLPQMGPRYCRPARARHDFDYAIGLHLAHQLAGWLECWNTGSRAQRASLRSPKALGRHPTGRRQPAYCRRHQLA